MMIAAPTQATASSVSRQISQPVMLVQTNAVYSNGATTAAGAFRYAMITT